MSNIIDTSTEISSEPIYLRKSAKICRAYLALLLLAFILSSLAKINDQFSGALIILMGLTLFVFFGLSPWGVYYTWKSKKRDEVNSHRRLTYAVAHWFVFVLLMLVIVRFVMDVVLIFKR